MPRVAIAAGVLAALSTAPLAAASNLRTAADLRAAAQPESLQAIVDATGDLGEAFKAASKPDGGWKYMSLKNAMKAIGTEECTPGREQSADKLLRLLCECWTGDPIR